MHYQNQQRKKFKFKIKLQVLLKFAQSLLDYVFYGDLVYKFKGIVGKPNFSDH